VILPTGETINYRFQLQADEGVIVKVSQNNMKPTELKMRGPTKALEISQGNRFY